jgi:ABC-type glucose/galactose transport system permease subunit
MKDKEKNKPVIETIINTSALALTAFGVNFIITNNAGWDYIIKGCLLILFGAGLEYFKYYGRKKRYW